jgi:hypothetical protein
VTTGLSDTDVESDQLQIALLRAAGPGRRALLALSLSASVIDLAYAGIRRRQPAIPDAEAQLTFVETHYGHELAAAIRSRREGSRT